MRALNTVLQGDVLEVLDTLPDDCVDCIVTSPPYWKQRDYHVGKQIGLEPQKMDYLGALQNVFHRCYRVLKPHGNLFVNIGTTFNNGVDECIPESFLEIMRPIKWMKRRTVIWYKPNVSPASYKNDFTLDFEYIYRFTKVRKNFFEQQFEPNKTKPPKKQGDGRGYKTKENGKQPFSDNRHGSDINYNPLGRNMRTVWTMATGRAPYESHYAVFPDELARRCIESGSSLEVCVACDTPRKKLYGYPEGRPTFNEWKKDKKFTEHPNYEVKGGGQVQGYGGSITQYYKEVHGGYSSPKIFLGYSDCKCNKGFRPSIILDPFSGTGTTLKVAKQLGRCFLGIELNPKDVEKSLEIVKNTAPLINELRGGYKRDVDESKVKDGAYEC